MARGRGSKGGEESGVPGWVVTYGDMMSLLLTFFVLLLSFSSIEEEDFNKAVASLQGALGVLPRQLTIIDLREEVTKAQARRFEDVAAKLAEYIRVHGRQDQLQVEYTKEGIKLTMQDPILFNTGEDSLKPVAIPVLTDIAGLLSDLSGDFINVEGHTDNVPIHTERFPSNLELSAARAITVARFLIDEGELDPKNVSMSGYGENLPVAPNDSAENRAKNRRVEINVLRERPTKSGRSYYPAEQGEETENAP